MKIRLSDIYIGNFETSQKFGENPSMYKRFGLNGHNGWDIKTPLGTKILAGHDGEVVRVQNDVNGYGIHVRLWNREQKFATIYAHLQKAVCVVGEKLVAGQLLGFANSTGFSTGHHLHFGVCKTDEHGVRINLDNGYRGWFNPLDGRRVEWDIKNLTEPVKPSSDKGIYTEEEMTKMRHERDRNWNLYQEEKSEKEGLVTQVRDYKQSIEAIARQLDCSPDTAEIKGKIESLLSVEDQKNTAEKKNKTLSKTVENLKQDLKQVKKTRDTYEKRYKDTSQELNACQRTAKRVGSLNKELENKVFSLEQEIIKLEQKIKEVKKPMAKKKKNNNLWEAVKEPLRLLVLAVIPFGITYFTDLDYKWAVYATMALRALDRYLHLKGKEENNKKLVKGLARF